MNSHQGAGACQAIEDAYILAKILGHTNTTRHTIQRALTIYDSTRRPFALGVQAKSKLTAKYLSFTAEGYEASRFTQNEYPNLKLEELGNRILEGWQW